MKALIIGLFVLGSFSSFASLSDCNESPAAQLALEKIQEKVDSLNIKIVEFEGTALTPRLMGAKAAFTQAENSIRLACNELNEQ